jgi:hypothetical protein
LLVLTQPSGPDAVGANVPRTATLGLV